VISFEYCAPQSLNEALSILASQGDDARVLAGGTDLMIQMKDGRRSPSVIVDAKRLPELNRLSCTDRTLHIGAAVPLSAVAAFPPMTQRFDMLQRACGIIGSMQLRNRGTVGGNICNAAPSADTAPSLLCLGATAIVARKGATRRVPIESFFLGPGQTAVESGELLLGLDVPSPGAQWSGCYLRHTPRQDMDISVAGVAAFLRWDKGNRENHCLEARIAIGAVAPTPMRVPDAELALAGQMVTEDLINSVAEMVARQARPISDVRGSAKYRTELVKVLAARALCACLTTRGNEAGRV
jgi:CO/xanthine dehydrogenase FAD-binding subunit